MQMDFFTGVPDSLLKNVCAYITDHFVTERNVIAANEGAAVGLAAGYYLATKKNTSCLYAKFRSWQCCQSFNVING